MDADRVIARPPLGSVNNQPAFCVRDLEVQVFMALAERRNGWMDQPLGPVATTILLLTCACIVIAGIYACPVR